eukprot:515431_1
MAKILLSRKLEKDIGIKIKPHHITFTDGQVFDEEIVGKEVGRGAQVLINKILSPTQIKKLKNRAETMENTNIYTLTYKVARNRLIPHKYETKQGFIAKPPNDDLVSQDNIAFGEERTKRWNKKGKRFIQQGENIEDFAEYAHIPAANTKGRGNYTGTIVQKWKNSGIVKEDTKKSSWRFNRSNHKHGFDSLMVGQSVKFTIELAQYKNNKNESEKQGLCYIITDQDNQRDYTNWRNNKNDERKQTQIPETAPIGKKSQYVNIKSKQFDELMGGLNVCYQQCDLWYYSIPNYMGDSKMAIKAMMETLTRKREYLKNKVKNPRDMGHFNLYEDTSKWIYNAMEKIIWKKYNIKDVFEKPKRNDAIKQYINQQLTEKQRYTIQQQLLNEEKRKCEELQQQIQLNETKQKEQQESKEQLEKLQKQKQQLINEKRIKESYCKKAAQIMQQQRITNTPNKQKQHNANTKHGQQKKKKTEE